MQQVLVILMNELLKVLCLGSIFEWL